MSAEAVPAAAATAAMRVAEALTDEQEQAVARRREPLLLAAAAGSGKTSVLVERFVRAVREDGLAPSRVLAITFTERAAGELRARVRARLLELGDREAARDTEAAFVGTFHGFCARLLRTHPLAAGLDPDFDVLDEGLAGGLRERAFRAALRDFLGALGEPAVDLLAAYKVDRVHAIVEQAHAELRSRGQLLPRLPQPSLDGASDVESREAARACALLDELLVRFAAAYAALKQQRGAVDFDDLELRARELLVGHEGVRAAWSERFELLMVDEFQDTNPRQLEILRALERANLFTVGDELQSIYGFRHADVGLFRERRGELERSGAVLALTRNFRSRPPLLEVVNAVFARRFEQYAPLRPGRPAAAGPAMAAEGPQVELLLTSTEGWEEQSGIAEGLPPTQAWRAAEARMLAQRVAELVAGGEARAGEVVVLLRATGDLEVFERALQLAGLRTLAAVGAFWGHQQVGDLLAYLRALANPLDEEALYSVLASPLAGCSRDGLALLAEAAREGRRGAWEAAVSVADEQAHDQSAPPASVSLASVSLASALPASAPLASVSSASAPLARLTPADRRALGAFVGRLRQERAGMASWTISELIEREVQASGYREHVLGLDWGERRLANMQKLLRLARRFQAGEGRDLRAFLDHVERLRESAQLEPDAPVEGVEPDAVRLMSIHAAKGLEFPVVCVADLGRLPNTQTPDLLVDGERIGLRLVRLDGGRSVPTLEYEALCEERREREAREEERVLYVAMTRARERLLLSGAASFERWPQSTRAPTPISWLGPALSEELPALARAGGVIHELDVAGVSVRCTFNSPLNVGTVLKPHAPDPVSSTTAADLQPSPGQAMDAGSRSLAEPPRPHPEKAEPAADLADRSSTPPAGDLTSARGARAPQRIEVFSYTSLTELERCGYRFYLERVLGLPEDRTAARSVARGSLEARARGTLVHRLMESFDFARPAPPGQEQIQELARELGVRVSPAERTAIERLIGAACAGAPVARVAAAASVHREHPFAFSLDAREPLVTGVIDLLAVEENGTHLVLDYKSDHVAQDTDLAELVQREYSIQRLLYALAVLRTGAPAVEIVHWFLERPLEQVAVGYTAAERDVLEDELRGRTAWAESRPYGVSAHPHRGLCLTCPGRAALCSWSEAETMREDPGAEATDVLVPSLARPEQGADAKTTVDPDEDSLDAEGPTSAEPGENPGEQGTQMGLF